MDGWRSPLRHDRPPVRASLRGRSSCGYSADVRRPKEARTYVDFCIWDVCLDIIWTYVFFDVYLLCLLCNVCLCAGLLPFASRKGLHYTAFTLNNSPPISNRNRGGIQMYSRMHCIVQLIACFICQIHLSDAFIYALYACSIIYIVIVFCLKPPQHLSSLIRWFL